MLLWAACATVPAALLLTFAPATAGTAWLLLGAFTAVAGADAMAGRRRLDDVQATVGEVTRLNCGEDGCIDVRLAAAPARGPRRLRLAVAVERPLISLQEAVAVPLPAKGGSCTVRWPCRGERRGRCFGTLCAMECASPAGFWLVVARRPIRGEVRIYPNLRREQRRLHARFLRRREDGSQAQRVAGKGREFEKLREYVPGDDVADIHWKATARRNYPVTKLFQIERTQEVYVALDTSRLTARLAPVPHAPEQVQPLLDRFIASALLLALAAEAQGDRFGLLAFDRQVHTFLGGRHGKAHYDAVRNALYQMLPSRVSPDYREFFSFIRTRLPKRCLIMVMTCADDAVLAEGLVDAARLAARHHLMAFNLFRPDGAAPLFTGDTPVSTEGVYDRLAGHDVWQRLAETERALQVLGGHTTQSGPTELAASLISQYMLIKRRQLL